MSKRLGQRIRRARKGEELTQAALAAKIGVSQTLIAKWESGGPGASKYLKSIEKVLGKIQPVKINSNKLREKMEELDVETDLGPSEFGIWLRQERSKGGMSVTELAAKSDLSAQAIYQIEKGKIQNPQKKTRESLASVLKASIPDEIENVAETESSVGIGTLTDFDPYSTADWPTCAGVYVLYDVSQRPIYVGKAKQIARRLKVHDEKFWFKRPIVEYASFVTINDATLRHQIEQTMIKFLKSNAVINKQSTDEFER